LLFDVDVYLLETYIAGPMKNTDTIVLRCDFFLGGWAVVNSIAYAIAEWEVS
jgi:hypothetical protein